MVRTPCAPLKRKNEAARKAGDEMSKHQMIYTPPGERSEERLGATVRAERKRRGVTQADFASMLGVRQSIVSRWETGAEPIPRRQMLKIVDIFENRSSSYHAIVDRLVRRADIGIQSPESARLLRSTKASLQAFQRDRSDVDGARISDVYDLSLHPRVAIEQPFVSILFERDSTAIGGNGPRRAARVLYRFFDVRLRHKERLILYECLSFRPATHAPPRIHEQVTHHDLIG